MITSLRSMVTCHWSARRIQRYLDADPSAPLSPGEVARLESHLAICERCAQLTEQHEVLRRALSRLPGRRVTDEAAVARLRTFVMEMTSEGDR